MKISSLIATACIAAAGAAEAQSYLESLARRAVESAAQSAVGAVASGARSGGNAPGAEASPAEVPTVMQPRSRRSPMTSAAEPTPVAAEGPAPWPLNALDATYTGDWEFDPRFEADIDALHEFAKVRCTGCEGGYSHDSWINHHLENKEEGGVPEMVGRLPVGGALTWRGIEATGRLEIISDAPIGAFPCKQVRTTMTRGARTAAALGLYCKGPTHSFDGDGWAKVLG